MAWDVEYTNEFGTWWDILDEDEQTAIDAIVRVLEQVGPALTRPYSDTVASSRHPNMKELRVQYRGRPFRLLYAFDPRRVAIILIGGDKSGDRRWYETFVPIADKIYDQHLLEIQQESEKKEVQ